MIQVYLFHKNENTFIMSNPQSNKSILYCLRQVKQTTISTRHVLLEALAYVNTALSSRPVLMAKAGKHVGRIIPGMLSFVLKCHA